MQKSAETFIDKYNLRTDISTRYLDLVSEIGELGKEIIKSTKYGKEDFTVNSQVVGEMGDCLFSLLALCSELNIDAQDALCKVLTKYERRFDEKGSIGSE